MNAKKCKELRRRVRLAGHNPRHAVYRKLNERAVREVDFTGRAHYTTKHTAELQLWCGRSLYKQLKATQC